MTATPSVQIFRRAGELLSFLAQGSGLIDPQAQNLQLERFAGERVGGEWQELGAGQVLNGFGVAREGLELKDMPSKGPLCGRRGVPSETVRHEWS